jgi:hypothetical protein
VKQIYNSFKTQFLPKTLTLYISFVVEVSQNKNHCCSRLFTTSQQTGAAVLFDGNHSNSTSCPLKADLLKKHFTVLIKVFVLDTIALSVKQQCWHVTFVNYSLSPFCDCIQHV